MTKRLYVVSFCVYVVVSIFTFLIYGAMPAILAKNGISPREIGLLYMAFLPFSLSFFYSGFVESFRKKYARGFQIINSVGVIGIGLLLFFSSALDLSEHFTLCIVACFLMSVLSANMLIALNGVAVEQTTSAQKPIINTIMLIACGLGGLIGIVVALIIFDFFGWSMANIVLGVFTLLFGVPILLIKITHTDSKVHDNSILKALKNKRLWAQFFILTSFLLPLVLTNSMSSALFVYMGFSLYVVGFLSGFLQISALLLAAPVAYFFIKFFGFKKALILALASEACVLVLLALNMWVWQSHFLVIILMLLNALFFGSQFVFMYSVGMRWCEGSTQSGVDLSFLRTSENIGFVVAGLVASQIIGLFVSEEKLASLQGENMEASAESSVDSAVNVESGADSIAGADSLAGSNAESSFSWINDAFATLQEIFNQSGIDSAVANGYGWVFVLGAVIAVLSVVIVKKSKTI